MSEWIHIKEVLADMERVEDGGKRHIFSLSWVRSTDSKNGKRGSIKHVRLATKHTKPQRKRSNGTVPSWQFKAYDTIPIQDIQVDQLLTPKWTHLISYNGKLIRHYGE
jgi:hypothetical protein